MYKEDISKAEIKKKTGIDLEMYRTDEIVESLEDILAAPFIIMLKLILWPLFFVALLLISAIWLIWPLSWAGAILWILIGLIMGPLCGIAVAAYHIGLDLGETTKKLYAATLDTIKTIGKDLKDNYHQIPDGQRLPSHKEWMRIVQLALIVPVVRELVKRKLWPVGTWIGKLLTLNLTKTSQKGEFLLSKEMEIKEHATKIDLESYSEMIIKNTEKIQKNLDSTHKATMRLTISPLRFTMYMTLGLTALFLLLIYYFFL
jgi:hypothetical protein